MNKPPPFNRHANNKCLQNKLPANPSPPHTHETQSFVGSFCRSVSTTAGTRNWLRTMPLIKNGVNTQLVYQHAGIKGRGVNVSKMENNLFVIIQLSKSFMLAKILNLNVLFFKKGEQSLAINVNAVCLCTFTKLAFCSASSDFLCLYLAPSLKRDFVPSQ